MVNIDDVNFSLVFNRNEKKVLKALAKVVSHGLGAPYAPNLTEKDYQDIYALALNRLPARYCQKGTIVVGEPVREADVEEAVRDAFNTVIRRPKE